MPRLSKIGAAALAAFGWTGISSVTATYLVVAGGGGGLQGGGGAGGLLTGTASLNPTLSYTVVVGAGGTSGVAGGNSSFTGLTTAIGGGTSAVDSNGTSGGSGGGGGQSTTTTRTGGAGTSGQGNAGGSNGGFLGNPYPGGGGGGSGAVGGNATSNSVAGNGGNGTASSISGSSVTYAGGGGGGVYLSGTGGSGGTGGGGAGSSATGTATSGTANLGGGGGGTGNGGTAGAGGSGVVIISYPGAQQFGGGVVTTDGTNTIHTFTTSGTLVPATPLTAQYLIVAGGGGGGGAVNDYTLGGGGGAGGLLTGTGVTIDTNSNYVVTVGAGGAGGTYNALGGNGGNSTWSMVSTTVLGGGAGSAQASPAAASGGSGGGGGSSATPAGGAGTSGQGNAGGTGVTFFGGAGAKSGGGGGGAGAVGGTASGATAGAGGIGVASSISGTSTYYAGGGGGGSSSAGGAGGNGGGGAGVTYNNNGVAGTAFTGGGGGGAARNNAAGQQTGGAGGSGIVIIAYPGSTQQMAGGTVTISGGNVIHTFTSSGYLTPIKYASRSLRFRSSASAFLSRTPKVAGNTTTFTYSVWAKRGALSANQYLFWGGNNCNFGFGLVGTDDIGGNLRGTGGTNYFFNTIGVFRDPSAWYHVVWAVDTTQATDTNRLKIYVNGVQQTLSVTYPPQNTVQLSTAQRNIGSESGRYYYDGYMTEVNFIDGAALTPSSFGTFNSYGVWQPITYGGSYGTNGFYLTFGNNTSTTTLGYDTSPQGNNWTTNNISLTAGTTYDSMTDVPTLTSATVANYPTWNPLTAGGLVTFSEANLKALSTSASAPYNIESTIKTSTTGKWYAEVTVAAGASNPAVGIGNNPSTSNSNTDQFTAYRTNATYITSGMGASSSGTPATFTTNDVIGIAYDVAAGTLVFYKNGTLQSGGFTGITVGSYSFIVRKDSASGDGGFLNCGQRPFTYTPPSGFVALNTYNLSTPTIPNGAVYMAATTYTGTGAALTVANTVNGTNFQPDFVWGKSRSAVGSHTLTDSVRGVNSQLFANATAAQNTNTDNLTAFNSNGFSFGTSSNYNGSGTTFVAWNWKANGTGVSNTDGTITSTVSANTTAGFAVVTYTGTNTAATVGHGLGVTPSMIIVKQRNSAVENWLVYHSSLTNPTTSYLYLNSTAAQATTASYWNGGPTSSVFGIGAYSGINASAGTYVAYVFAAVAGYSAMGSYTGNGSTDGPFVYTGFRPRFVLIKCSSNATSSTVWTIFDTSRSPYNASVNELYPNLNAVEGVDSSGIDILSNGFKPKRNSEYANLSGWTYIYYAVAENPFKYSSAR